MASGIEPLTDIDRVTGELISGWPRCRQSIITILTTRLLTRIMRLWFGSNFLDIQDKPINAQSFNESIMSALIDIDEFEPEFSIKRVLLGGTPTAGNIEVTVEGEYLPEKTSRRFSFAL